MTEPGGPAAALIDEGVALYNAGRFWEAHEAFEAVWRGAGEAERPLWQGLIQAAAALLHQSRGNAHGVAVVGGAAVEKLRRPAPPGFPIETRGFADALARCLASGAPTPEMKRKQS